jgi:hypothetical protein
MKLPQTSLCPGFAERERSRDATDRNSPDDPPKVESDSSKARRDGSNGFRFLRQFIEYGPMPADGYNLVATTSTPPMAPRGVLPPKITFGEMRASGVGYVLNGQ